MESEIRAQSSHWRRPRGPEHVARTANHLGRFRQTIQRILWRTAAWVKVNTSASVPIVSLVVNRERFAASLKQMTNPAISFAIPNLKGDHTIPQRNDPSAHHGCISI